MLKFFINVFFYIFSPLIFASCFILRFLIPVIRKRWDLETAENNYSRDQIACKICFEVSSEGELEQVKPLIQKLLNANVPLEIIYCSGSVQKQVYAMCEKYPLLLRSKCLPVISFLPFGKHNVSSWTGAATLVLCRYDFFPELIYLGMNKKFILVSATLKNKSYWVARPGSLGFFVLKHIYNLFDVIVAATEQDKEKLANLDLNQKIVGNFDFRILQIFSRLDQKEVTLKKFKSSSLFTHLSKFPIEKRLILGSAWPEDLQLIKSSFFRQTIVNEEAVIVIAPHLVTFDSRIETVELLNSMGLSPVVIDENNFLSVTSSEIKARPIVLQVKGILCELYSYFGSAYVGGGFGRSIHSVLEPFVAGCKVYCGPKTHRSTEFDLVRELSANEIQKVYNEEEFYQYFMKDTESRKFSRESWKKLVNEDFTKMGSLIYEHT